MLPSFVLSSAVAMSGERDGASAASWRRERRLRSWWRHEQQCVRMALTAAAHHSAEKVVAGETYSGLRAQKTVSEGRRPGVLKDPGPPWVEAVTVGCVAASVPPLGVPLLQGDEGVDAVALEFLDEAEAKDLVKFLLQKAFAQKEEEERRKEVAKQQEEKHEAKMLLLSDRVSHGLPLTEDEGAAWREWIVLVPSSSSSGREEEEEEEEEASTSSWCADTTLRARVPLSLFIVWCSVFPLVVDKPEMPCITAGMYQMDSSSLVVVCGSGMCNAGLAGYDTPRVMFRSGVARLWDPLHHGRYGPEGLTLRALFDSLQWHVQRWFLLVILHLVLFFSSSCRPAQMLGILAGMDQLDSFVVLMVQTEANCGVSAVAVPYGRRHFLHGRECPFFSTR